jgi:hypothetical protein
VKAWSGDIEYWVARRRAAEDALGEPTAKPPKKAELPQVRYMGAAERRVAEQLYTLRGRKIDEARTFSA